MNQKRQQALEILLAPIRQQAEMIAEGLRKQAAELGYTNTATEIRPETHHAWEVTDSCDLTARWEIRVTHPLGQLWLNSTNWLSLRREHVPADVLRLWQEANAEEAAEEKRRETESQVERDRAELADLRAEVERLREQVTTARAHVARLGGRLARARHALKD